MVCGVERMKEQKKQDAGLQALCSLLQTMWYGGWMFCVQFFYGDGIPTRVLETLMALHM